MGTGSLLDRVDSPLRGKSTFCLQLCRNSHRLEGCPCRYLHERGDANIQTIRDLIDKARFFEDERYDMQRPDLESRLADTKMDSSVRMQFRFAVQQVVYAAMADLRLDAFVAPTSNAPAPKLGAPRPLGRHKRPDIWSFLGSQGIPNITVPAGFTTHVYDRVRDNSVDPTSIDDDETVEGCENAPTFCVWPTLATVSLSRGVIVMRLCR